MNDHGLAAVETADARAEKVMLRGERAGLDSLMEIMEQPDVIGLAVSNGEIIVTRQDEDGEWRDEVVT